MILSEFLWVYNQLQSFSLPVHHLAMCAFLEKIWHQTDTQKALLMAFRNSGKSTIVGIFCAWVLKQNPNVRILILSADHELAKKMVRNIKRIIEKHPLTESLLPAMKEEWASDKFTVRRTSSLRDPSVLARGLMANITGCRADLIICDDVEVPKTCDTALKRQDLRQKLSELEYILTPGGMMLYIGTPHTAETIYNTDGFLKGYQVLKIPILNKTGTSNWPERFSLKQIQAIKEATGPQKFASQMMLCPVALADCRLNPDLLQIYQGELNYREANGAADLSLEGKKLVAVACWWDPAFAQKSTGDGSVVACVFLDGDGHYFLHRLEYIKVPPDKESADFQCKAVADFIDTYYIPHIYLETNGIGKFLPALLRQELSRRRLRCAVIEKINTKPKTDRILSAFDVVLNNKSLFVHHSLKKTSFFREMREFDPLKKNNKDDALDAVAGCLLAEPVRLPAAGYGQKQFLDWRF